MATNFRGSQHDYVSYTTFLWLNGTRHLSAGVAWTWLRWMMGLQSPTFPVVFLTISMTISSNANLMFKKVKVESILPSLFSKICFFIHDGKISEILFTEGHHGTLNTRIDETWWHDRFVVVNLGHNSAPTWGWQCNWYFVAEIQV